MLELGFKVDVKDRITLKSWILHSALMFRLVFSGLEKQERSTTLCVCKCESV